MVVGQGRPDDKIALRLDPDPYFYLQGLELLFLILILKIIRSQRR